jgi:hypothetical protein
MRSSTALVLACALVLAGCGESDPPAQVTTKSAEAAHSEFVGSWQAGGTFAGGCTDLACPSQYSFRLELNASGDCAWNGQTRSYRSNSTTGEWDYEGWHRYAPTQGPCKWNALDDWHVRMTLRGTRDAWLGKLNGSILEVTSPVLQKLRVHFSRVDE